MAGIRGSEALVSLFQGHPQDCSDSIYTPALKPRALTITSTSSKATTYVDVTHRGRSPCGRYNLARVLTTSLRRSSLPAPTWITSSASGSESVPSCPSLRGSASSSSAYAGSITAPSTPPPSAPPSHPPSPSPPKPPGTLITSITNAREPGRLGGLRRLLSDGQESQDKPKLALRPLVLPHRVGAFPEPVKKSNEYRRISLATVTGWLPLPLPLHIPLPLPGLTSITAQPYSASTPPSQNSSSRLKPLKLNNRSTLSENSSFEDANAGSKSERTNLLAWLLDCIARDIKPHWSVVPWGDVDDDERAKMMMSGNGQARCLAVREKRRSALF